jgi:hypothetical protein
MLAVVMLVPAAARAQVTARVFADAGVTVFAATQSFKAVLGRPSGAVFGGGVEIDNRQWFLTLGVRRFHRSGHRVFVFNNQVFPLNVKDTITVTPLDLTVGRRFRWRGIIPYAGGGIGWHRYDETSDHATDEEDVSKSYTGYHVLGGAEKAIHRWLAAAVEAQWAGVPNAFGESTTSVSQVYGEHNLGGFTLSGRIIVGR